jgi:hypothetical protein
MINHFLILTASTLEAISFNLLLRNNPSLPDLVSERSERTSAKPNKPTQTGNTQMTKTQQELYELALSKMAIPTCECLLDEPDELQTSIKNNNKDTKHDTNRTTRTGTILAQAQNKIP